MWNLGLLGAAGGTLAAAGESFDLLQTEILTGTQAVVSFSNLNSTYGTDYKHLQIRMAGRSTRSATNSDFRINFNGDTGSNYTWHYTRGDGSATESAGTGGLNYIRGYQALTGATHTGGSFAATVIDIVEPFNTNKNTTVSFVTGMVGSLNRVLLESGAWLNTSPITSITLDDLYGSSFVQYSRFSLYGLKAA
jgi:hypothetical protein